MRYIVIPAGKRVGCCQIRCNTMEQAQNERKELEVLTGKEWTVVVEP